MTTQTLTYREATDDAIAVLAARGREFTADDVRALITERHPGLEPEHVNHLGLAFMSAAGAHRIVRVDTTRTTRHERNSSHQYVWIGGRL
jgi:hypothetical protein